MIVRHFKGNYYVIAVPNCVDSEHCEDREFDRVIYRPLYVKNTGDHPFDGQVPTYNRPLTMFTEDVDRPEYNYKGHRFAPVQLPFRGSELVQGTFEGISKWMRINAIFVDDQVILQQREYMDNLIAHMQKHGTIDSTLRMEFQCGQDEILRAINSANKSRLKDYYGFGRQRDL